jgi:hypothetical protein
VYHPCQARDHHAKGHPAGPSHPWGKGVEAGMDTGGD